MSKQNNIKRFSDPINIETDPDKMREIESNLDKITSLPDDFFTTEKNEQK